MAKYLVVGLVDASVHEHVEADSPEEALEKTELHASVCHQCSDKMDVGDVIAYRVIDNDGMGVEVYDDSVLPCTEVTFPEDLELCPKFELVERQYIEHVLAKLNGDKTKAARVLGVARRTIYRKLAQYAQDDFDKEVDRDVRRRAARGI